MVHEASLHDSNSFLTITYSDEHLPEDGSLSVRAVQLFFKRLRKSLGPTRIRYFAVGEYGELTWRPHYHAIIFGYQFPDLVPWRATGRGNTTYRSAFLEQLWPWGHCEVGHVSSESAGYVARYCMKKVGGERAAAHYVRPHPLTGEFWRIVPEFALMSRRPGIGSGWYDQFSRDCFPSDYLVIDGQKRPVPRYYKSKLEEDAKLRLAYRTKKEARKRASDSTPDRLAVREEVVTLRTAALKRTVGDDT